MNSLLLRLDAVCDPEVAVAFDAGGGYSIKDMAARCQRVAATLQESAVKVLALHADNSIDWMVVDLACQQAGICLVPLPTFFSAEQLNHVLKNTPIDAVLCDHSELFTLLLRATSNPFPEIPQLQMIRITPQVTDASLPQGTDKITYTSGSTGRPKGVCLSSGQLLMQADALAKAVDIPEVRHLCLLPLSTLLENVAGIYAPVVSKGEVVIPSLTEIGYQGSSSLDPGRFIRTIDRYTPNSIIITPELLRLLVSAVKSGWKPTSTLQFVAVGGSRVSPTLLSKAQSLGIPAYEGYGLSECASVVSLNTDSACRTGTCGKPLSYLEVTLEEGEIVVAGNAMLGYVGEPDSWGQERIHTGDLGHFSSDGFLHVDGRKKNVLISGFGRNINPEWVESELLCSALVAECIVFGDARPYCIALISPHNPSTDDETLQCIVDETNSRLPDYARIHAWQRLPQPLRAQQELITDNGKPKRNVIETYYRALIDSLYASEYKVENL